MKEEEYKISYKTKNYLFLCESFHYITYFSLTIALLVGISIEQGQCVVLHLTVRTHDELPAHCCTSSIKQKLDTSALDYFTSLVFLVSCNTIQYWLVPVFFGTWGQHKQAVNTMTYYTFYKAHMVNLLSSSCLFTHLPNTEQ